MATAVIEPIEVVLDNDKKLVCVPLKIKQLRKFMQKIEALTTTAVTNAESVDILFECCVIAVDQYSQGTITPDELEDNIDLPRMYRVIEGASGIVLDEVGESNPQ